MRRIRILVTYITVFVVTFSTVSPALAWKPKTHLFTAAEAIEEIIGISGSCRDVGPYTVTVDGKSYNIEPEVAEAIRCFPEYYFGGVVGPDAFPDILFGQTKIHPDSRCENGGKPVAECNFGKGVSFTDDWLQFIYKMGWKYYWVCSGMPEKAPATNDPVKCIGDERPGAVLAFTYGFLTHAAGDMWGHTFVNEYARGEWPFDIFAPDSDPGIAIRHIIVEGYVGEHTFGSRSGLEALDNVNGLNAPTNFIYQTLIISNTARKLAAGSHFDKFLLLKTNLEDTWRPKFNASRAVCNAFLDPVTAQAQCLTAREYIDAWVDDIDEGLKEWPNMSLDVANDLFYEDDTDAAILRIKEFSAIHLTSMIGFPDPVGKTLGTIINVSSLLSEIAELNPLKILEKQLIEEATGIDIDQWKEYFKNPVSYINCDEFPPAAENLQIRLDTTTSTILDREMDINNNFDSSQIYTCHRVPPPPMTNIEKFDSLKFAAANNTIVLSKLILLSSDELNKLLHDHHVGAIYGRDHLYGYPENFVFDNALLGFIGAIDGNHQWRDYAPETAASGSKRFSISIKDKPDFVSGMPLWKDCLARERVFRVIFTDWQNEWTLQNFPDLGEGCEDISAPLPPVEFNIVPTQDQLNKEVLCGAPTFQIELINHRATEQSYALYGVEVDPRTREPLYRRVIPGIPDVLAGFETKDVDFPPTGENLPVGCKGSYIVDFYLFEKMLSLDVRDQIANPFIQRRPDEHLPAEVVSHQQRGFTVDTSLCQFTCLRCSSGPTVGTSTPSGAISSSNVMPPDGIISSGSVVPPGSGLTCTQLVEFDCDPNCRDLPQRVSHDADKDGIEDTPDNCPTIKNPDQGDVNSDRVGDVCQPPAPIDYFDKSQMEVLLSLLAQKDKIRIAQTLEMLFGDPTIHSPWCLMGLTCPDVLDELLPSISKFTKAFDQDQISAGYYASVMRDIVRGPMIHTVTTNVESVSLNADGGTVKFSITAPMDDLVTIRLSRGLLNARANDQGTDLVVLVDGSIRLSTEIGSSNYRILEIPVRAGDSEIAIQGTQLGPNVNTNATNQLKTIIILLAIVFTLILAFFALRFRRKATQMVSRDVENKTTSKTKSIN